MDGVLWQLADSAFPAGGFAHSGGLEAAMQHGRVTGGDGVWTFARHTVLQTGRGALPIVTAAHRDPDRLPELDRWMQAFLSNPIANRASCAQGRALLTSCVRSFPAAPLPRVVECVDREALAAHHAPLFGVITGALGLPLDRVQRLSLYLAVRGVGAAAVRLGLIGAYEAQQMQAALASDIEAAISRFGQADSLEIAQPVPLVDLFQSMHDRLYSRLFQS